jgi:hypothetical protein
MPDSQGGHYNYGPQVQHILQHPGQAELRQTPNEMYFP